MLAKSGADEAVRLALRAVGRIARWPGGPPMSAPLRRTVVEEESIFIRKLIVYCKFFRAMRSFLLRHHRETFVGAFLQKMAISKGKYVFIWYKTMKLKKHYVMILVGINQLVC